MLSACTPFYENLLEIPLFGSARQSSFSFKWNSFRLKFIIISKTILCNP